MLAHERDDLVELSLSPDEAGQREGQVGGCAVGPWAGGDRRSAAQQHRTRGGRLELSALLVVECQRIGQKRERFALRRASITTLERANSVGAHPGTLGERLLRESRGQSITAEEHPEVRRARYSPAVLHRAVIIRGSLGRFLTTTLGKLYGWL